MAPSVQTVTPLDPYMVRVVFADGEVRDVDIEPLLEGVVFRALRDPEVFQEVRGADLDPDVLYGSEQPSAEPAPRITVPQRT